MQILTLTLNIDVMSVFQVPGKTMIPTSPWFHIIQKIMLSIVNARRYTAFLLCRKLEDLSAAYKHCGTMTTATVNRSQLIFLFGGDLIVFVDFS